MKCFNEPVVSYMSRDLEVAHLDTPLVEIARIMHGRGFSGMPVVDGKGHLVGVVSRTDLIRSGLHHSGRRSKNRVMTLPERTAKDVMTHGAYEIDSSAPLRDAANEMVEHEVHRIFVTEGGALSGVICASDLAAAVHDAGVSAPISTIMTSPIVTVDVLTPIARSIELLDSAHVTGLIVLAEGQPVGMFAQPEALASRDLPGDTPIEDVYSAAVICLPDTTKLHRAAAHVAQSQVRRVVVCKAREAVGVITATDFARFVALA
jgi:CBS domain-containing protein